MVVRGIQAEAKGSLTLAESTKAELGGKYHEQVTGITKLVANDTERLMTRFGLLYQAYAGSPCTREEWFLQRVDQLMGETHRVERLKLGLEVIVAVFKRGAGSPEIIGMFQQLTAELSQSAATRETVSAIKGAASLIEEWRKP